jgi:hypothetical protein
MREMEALGCSPGGGSSTHVGVPVRFAQRAGFYSLRASLILVLVLSERFPIRFSRSPLLHRRAHRRGVVCQIWVRRILRDRCVFGDSVPEGAVTFTVSRTVQVVFGAMLAFSWHTICPVP